jgi:hypothetical protein
MISLNKIINYEITDRWNMPLLLKNPILCVFYSIGFIQVIIIIFDNDFYHFKHLNADLILHR